MINILRIEKQIYKQIYDHKELLGQVEHIYNNGFDIVSENGDLLYFQGEKWLQSPFSIVLDADLNRWIADVSLSKGDVFCIDGERIYSLNNRNVNLHIHEPTVIDLKNTTTFNSYSKNDIVSWAQEIVDRLLPKGRFEGLLATLEILKDSWPELQIDHLEKPNRWSQSALPGIRKLLKSSVDKESGLFKDAWDTLIGLGPGLTPSGDDLLVGYLAIQYKFNSSIKSWLYNSGILDHIVGSNKGKTTSISRQFLTCASNGLFSEMLLCVINCIIIKNQIYKKKRYSVLDDFLCWGHSSGRDIMVGILMGFFTLIAVTEK